MSIIDKIIEKFNLNFRFLNRKNSPSNKASFKNSNRNTVQQASRDINIGVERNEDVSESELKILRKLYSHYRETGMRSRLDINKLNKELGISDGHYVGTINTSKFIEIDGNDYTIKDTGIRSMDSWLRNNKPEIDIISLAHSGGPRGEELTGLRLINNGSGTAIGIECYLCADDVEDINFARIERLTQNEESRSSLGFLYSHTPFSSGPLKNLRIVFKYNNKDGFKFSSGRFLNQKKRHDSNYNIVNHPLGDYFENKHELEPHLRSS